MSQWTKKAIMDCFTRQIEVKPLDRIRVKDIVEECGITRNTFYYHFSDVFDLAKQTLILRLGEMSESSKQTDSWESFLLLIARQMATNKRTILHLFRTPQSGEINRFMADLLGMAMNRIFDDLAKGKKIPADQRRLIIDFYSDALTGTVSRWLTDNDGQEPEHLVPALSKLVLEGMKQAIEQNN
ncbi:MAG: TetR/AcrR family transcriptional regulator C-terminal domain-containing protein [Clostridia bacterium]|nr:TetR/AcrR family transcriptional regulator C-terminal domain-containing protein [Clostridia bacterium]